MKMSPTRSAGWTILFASAAFADPAIAPSALTVYSAGQQSCKVDTTDIAIPTSGRDVQDNVTRYMTDPSCHLKLPVAIESLFSEENRNEEWAESLERIVKEAAEARGAKITGVCHTSLCRYDIELRRSVESSRSPFEVERRVIDATSGTPLQVSSLHCYRSNVKFTIYFYSTVVPAAFLEPLRKIMDTNETVP